MSSGGFAARAQSAGDRNSNSGTNLATSGKGGCGSNGQAQPTAAKK